MKQGKLTLLSKHCYFLLFYTNPFNIIIIQRFSDIELGLPVF